LFAVGAGVLMPTQNNSLKDHLSRSSELTITVTGRKSGRTISLPIWFVWDGTELSLLPVKGSDTQWYKNVLNNPSIQIDVGGAQAELKVDTITNPQQMKSVVEKFREKYGPDDVKKDYSKLVVAVIGQPTGSP
jgi:hypothetical protein